MSHYSVFTTTEAEKSQKIIPGTIRIVCGGVVAVLLIISVLFCLKMPMTCNRHSALLKAIRLKKEGKGYETSKINDIL